MKKKIILFISVISIFNCTYEDPFKEYDGKNLISRLDLTSDWVIDSGVQIDATDEIPPSGYNKCYYFYFINLLDEKSSNFETSINAGDTGNWIASANNPGVSASPSNFEVVPNPSDKLEGNKSLYIKLDNNPDPKYIYYEFTPVISTNYTFKFDYYSPGASGIGISFGLSDNSNDEQIFNDTSPANTKDSIFINFVSLSANPSQIKFGFKENKNWESGIDLYIDKIALFASSNHSVSKLLNIVESKDQTNDGTGEIFHEGVYRFLIYAKSYTSNILTMKIGGATKEFTLTDSWKKYNVEAQILRTEGFLKLEILPTSTDDSKKFPGGIFITKPELYFLYNQPNPN
ncbi:MAG TPA: hypothetical protein PLE45_06875 [Spirochaetota bacterium]|nr:hypothetical protein [Spirochaetota bacterium]HPP04161.1 hypothetical protein [Spirochaetota bacterium]